METKDRPEISPTKLAAALGAGLIALVIALSFLAAPEVVVDLAQLDSLISQDALDRLEVSATGLIGRLRRPTAVGQAGRRLRAESVIVPRRAGDREQGQALRRWRQAGLPVVEVPYAGDGRRWREMAAMGLVGALLSFGVYHLVHQARSYRRHGSPRQRLAQAQDALAAGELTSEEYDRRVAEISVET